MYDNEFETNEYKIETKDKIEPQFQYGKVGGGWGGVRIMLLSQKKKRILICFDSASHRVQPTVPTFFLVSDTDQSNNTQIMRTGNNNDSITIINNNNNNSNNNICIGNSMICSDILNTTSDISKLLYVISIRLQKFLM